MEDGRVVHVVAAETVANGREVRPHRVVRVRRATSKAEAVDNGHVVKRHQNRRIVVDANEVDVVVRSSPSTMAQSRRL